MTCVIIDMYMSYRSLLFH